MLVVIAGITVVYNYYLISPTYYPSTAPTPAHYAGIDKFAIKEIYPTKTGGEERFMNIDDPGYDPRIGGEGPSTTFVQQNDDGSWKVQNTEVAH